MPRWYTHTSLGYGCALNRECSSFLMYNDILNGNDVLYLGLFFTSTPSSRLKTILNKYNLTNPVYVLEHNPINKLSLPVPFFLFNNKSINKKKRLETNFKFNSWCLSLY